ncbi:Dyp-type peroxidase [Myroides odoratimimus]|uniref:Dyp-type peroxidase n=1 Tax=Myroides odoratimimus TaxID=76832 RepID=UPI002DBC61A9|nr:Dyp-type peroxidase [Myroides odoratimimus]MEC4077129.1 Dyp-type peroxidase [Myroides odoratimimus]
MSQKTQNVTDYPNNNTIFSVWKFKEGAEIKQAFEALCGLVNNLNNSFKVRVNAGPTSCILGVSHNAWLKLDLPTPMPKELKVFEEIKGDKHTAVSTDADLHLHLSAINPAICYDMAMAISKVLLPVADCIDEVQGFKYWDGRAIIGFVDGTENPIGEDRDYFGIVGNEDPQYKGGSYLFVQKYIHFMKDWDNLSTEEQEKVIGRYKATDIEMEEDKKPANSHTALTAIEDEDGNELKIIRANMPYANPSKGQAGTYFISYASTFSTTEKMLKNMFIGEPAGNYDRILDFSKAISGTLFFVPSLDILDDYSAE